MEDINFILRPFCKADENFIINSWLKSARDNQEFKSVDNTTYFKEQAEVVIKLLKRGCVVLSDISDKNHIYGYIVFDPILKEAHFCYLKFSYRKLPISLAKKLFELIDDTYIATTYNKKNKIKYNPFARYK